MSYPKAWMDLINKGYFATDGRPLGTRSYPELFRQIGYGYGGNGDVFLIPKVVDRDGEARYAIHSVTGDMIDVRLHDEYLNHRETPVDGPAALDPAQVMADCLESLEAAREALQRSQEALDQGRTILRAMQNVEKAGG